MLIGGNCGNRPGSSIPAIRATMCRWIDGSIARSLSTETVTDWRAQARADRIDPDQCGLDAHPVPFSGALTLSPPSRFDNPATAGTGAARLAYYNPASNLPAATGAVAGRGPDGISVRVMMVVAENLLNPIDATTTEGGGA
jgi:hypothetical protein